MSDPSPRSAPDYDGLVRGLGIDVDKWSGSAVKTKMKQGQVVLNYNVPTTHRFSIVHALVLVLAVVLAYMVVAARVGQEQLDIEESPIVAPEPSTAE